jgi:hypothetical protein
MVGEVSTLWWYFLKMNPISQSPSISKVWYTLRGREDFNCMGEKMQISSSLVLRRRAEGGKVGVTLSPLSQDIPWKDYSHSNRCVDGKLEVAWQLPIPPDHSAWLSGITRGWQRRLWVRQMKTGLFTSGRPIPVYDTHPARKPEWVECPGVIWYHEIISLHLFTETPQHNSSEVFIFLISVLWKI